MLIPHDEFDHPIFEYLLPVLVSDILEILFSLDPVQCFPGAIRKLNYIISFLSNLLQYSVSYHRYFGKKIKLLMNSIMESLFKRIEYQEKKNNSSSTQKK